ncbi:aldehyde dehydrogenase family protein [Corticibacterium sp. UT-5YL-CI-8]|nr:aldehyde dehydrogenase family protein [Tianweitania sp. UT-5YL-CI-8]
MNTHNAISAAPIETDPLPRNRALFYGGKWLPARSGATFESVSPGSGRSLGLVADAGGEDVDAAVRAAHDALAGWRDTPPLERAKMLRAMAALVRKHARELALLDALDCGNPVAAMVGDAEIAASQLDFFAGLVTEMKGASIPMGPGRLNTSIREPLGVVARIVPFNHPFMFVAGKSAAPLAAGNTVVMKPSEQAPLSALRLAELIEGILPPGVFNVVTGSTRSTGEALVAHPLVAKVALIGSVNAGKAVMRQSADTLKQVLLELGGKNALIAYPDADPREVARALVAGMNFAWCGQSCGSTSRGFIHEAIHAEVLTCLKEDISAFKPGLPEDWSTTMGAISSRAQYERVRHYIGTAIAEGATLLCGGGRPAATHLSNGLFIEPTVFHGVTSDMTIAREEIFGPVLSLLSWKDEAEMFSAVNGGDLGLTCSIWTNNLQTAMRAATTAQAGFVWVNEVSKHFLGAPFGGYKQSGIGREECVEELISFTQEKNIHIRFG